MNEHHVWCSRLVRDQRKDGSCAECDRLVRDYPAEGHLYLEAPAYYYFPGGGNSA